MATQAPYYRVPVVIFAVLVGGLYVYAKSGGSLFTPQPHVTPAANASGDEPGAPSVEFMLGSKSAPAFDAEPRPTVHHAKPRAPADPPRPILLPGSKSFIVELPTSPPAAQPPPPPTNYAPPSNYAPPTNNAAPPTNAAPDRRALFSGSKSAAIIGPESLTPPPQPTPPVGQQPDNRGVAFPRNLAPRQSSQQQAAPNQGRQP